MPCKEQMRAQEIPSPDHLDAIAMGTAPLYKWFPQSGTEMIAIAQNGIM